MSCGHSTSCTTRSTTGVGSARSTFSTMAIARGSASRSPPRSPAGGRSAFMEQLIELHGKPDALRLDNGSELTSHAFVDWAKDQRNRAALHRARQAEPERLHRAVQPDLSGRGAQRVPVRIDRAGAADHRRLADRIQRAAASRLPRASAAADLYAEGNTSRRVQLQTVHLAGELTRPNRPVESGYRVST